METVPWLASLSILLVTMLVSLSSLHLSTQARAWSVKQVRTSDAAPVLSPVMIGIVIVFADACRLPAALKMEVWKKGGLSNHFAERRSPRMKRTWIPLQSGTVSQTVPSCD